MIQTVNVQKSEILLKERRTKSHTNGRPIRITHEVSMEFQNPIGPG